MKERDGERETERDTEREREMTLNSSSKDVSERRKREREALSPISLLESGFGPLAFKPVSYR